MHTHLEQWAADAAAPGEQLRVRCLAQGSHLSRGQFLLEPRFEPTTSGYKSTALSIRATTAPTVWVLQCVFDKHICSQSQTYMLISVDVVANQVHLSQNPLKMQEFVQCGVLSL